MSNHALGAMAGNAMHLGAVGAVLLWALGCTISVGHAAPSQPVAPRPDAAPSQPEVAVKGEAASLAEA